MRLNTISYIKTRLADFMLHDDSERKRVLTIMLLLAGITAASVFLVQDIIMRNGLEAFIDLLIIFLFSYFTALCFRIKAVLWICRISIGSLLLGLLLVTVVDIGHGTKLFLFLIFPQVFHILLGNREGLTWDLVTMSCVVLIISIRPDRLDSAYPAFLCRFSVAFICICAVSYIQERIREQYMEQLLQEKNELTLLNEKVIRLSITDKLTGLYNRGYLDQHLEKEFKRSIRTETPLAIAICDIDHFKRVNDRYGHQAGDKVLAEFSNMLTGSLRKDVDWVARYGGEEFLIVLPGINTVTAVNVVERIRHNVAGRLFKYDRTHIRITASFGVAVLDHRCSSVPANYEMLIQQADHLLYTAKEKGRNQVVTA